MNYYTRIQALAIPGIFRCRMENVWLIWIKIVLI